MTLSVDGLTVRYQGAAVVEGAAFEAPAGAVTALIGPNGAGKSTLLKAVAGLAHSTGEVRIDGAEAKRRRDVAYMPQDTSAASGLTMLEAVMLGRLRSLGWSTPPDVVAAAASLLARFGLADLSERPLQSVSGGQRQLAFLAQALMRAPRALLLDEPTAALDLRHQMLVLETVRADAAARGVAVVAAMHDLSLAGRFADRVICLQNGRVAAAGSPAEVLTEDRVLQLYRVRASVVVADGRPQIDLLGAAD